MTAAVEPYLASTDEITDQAVTNTGIGHVIDFCNWAATTAARIEIARASDTGSRLLARRQRHAGKRRRTKRGQG